MKSVALLASSDELGGVFGSLPPWGILLVGVGLLGLGALLHLLDKKLKNDFFLLEFAAMLCGIAGIMGIFLGLFGE